MTRMTTAFKTAINTAFENMDLVTDPVQKATIAAQIALAIASTGLVNELEENAEDITVAETKEETKAEEKEEQGVEFTRDDLVVEPEDLEPPKPEEWTDELREKYAKEWIMVNYVKDCFGEESFKQCLDLFFQDDVPEQRTVEDITPINIMPIAIMFKELILDGGGTLPEGWN